MSERKVLNKYYPPDFDPSKIPRMKLAKNRQFTVRLMAPFNMRCKTCGEYIYKGKKFNARKEDVENETYLGIRIYRFYIKCTRCLQEISFKTDPKNTDYEIEAGATRNFMALKLAEEQARREEKEEREEEANNPMKLLENRTQQSRNEIEILEKLEELRDLNRRQQTIDYEHMLEQYSTVESERQRLERQEKEDEDFIKSVQFKNQPSTSLKRTVVEVIEEEAEVLPSTMNQPLAKVAKPMPTLTKTTNNKLANLVKPKQPLVLVKPKTQLINAMTTKSSSNKETETTTTTKTATATPQSNTSATKSTTKTAGLSLLAAYSSDSDNASSD